MPQIGHRAWPLDWEARTTGAAPYTADIAPANTLFGAVLRSPHAHARITAIDVSGAERMPGVRSVITARHFPPGARYMHERVFDRAPLADGVVRFVGQEIAAVAADTQEQAQAAAAAIRVTYHLLSAPFRIAEALTPGAPVLHAAAPAALGPQPGSAAPAAPPPGGPRDAAPSTGGPPGARPGPGAPSFPALPFATNVAPNVRRAFRRQWGDAEKGRRAASVSVSRRFWFGQQTHICMETNRTLAEWTPDGRLHLWTSTAAPVHIKRQVAFVLGIDPNLIRVHEVAVGGSFGSKANICDHEAIVAVLAREARRPVLLALSREEEFETTKTRHGFEIDLTLRADAKGRLRAIEGAVRADNGAYIHSGGSVTCASILSLGVLYSVDGIDVDVKLVDTSKTPGGAFRGYGAPQIIFALESLMDELAYKLHRDPIEFRTQNTYACDVQSLAGHIGQTGLAECMRAARAAIDWDHRKAKKETRLGVGLAIGEHVSGAHILPDSNRCDGIIDLYADGRLRVRFGGSDCGTGQKTILAQIAAQELGVPLDRISVYSMDTDETPWDLGAWSSRGTHYTGHAISLTAREFAARLKCLAARELGSTDICLEEGFARCEAGEIRLGDLVSGCGESVDGVLTHKASFVDPHVEMLTPDGRGNITATHNYGAHAALVDVDEKTGRVRVLDYVAAVDAGTAMNPLLLEGQVAGGVVMGLGAALSEELIYEQGKLVNPALLHYAVPRAADVPRIRAILTPRPDPNGPYGAKGAGEVGIVPVPPTIANAVCDAIGVRISDLPLTPDKVLSALAEKHGRRRDIHLWRRPGRWYIEVVRRMYPLGLLRVLHLRRMRAFQGVPPALPVQALEAPRRVSELVAALGPDARLLGGGTDLHLCRRQNILAPARLISTANADGLKELRVPERGAVTIGAAATLAAFAEGVRTRAPGLAAAIDEIATPQIRNVATVGGNLLQEKRCWFFRSGFQCYKRTGSALAPCYAIMGDHRFYHAVIDGHRCQAVTPSDLATVLIALDAVIHVEGPGGAYALPAESLYKGPGEHALGARDVLTHVVIPAEALQGRLTFRKLNLWQGDFAIASAALSVARDADGLCTSVRLCLGAVAPVPWRARATERRLVGRALSIETLRAALDEELNRHAHPLARNAWKLDAVAGLAERAAEALLGN